VAIWGLISRVAESLLARGDRVTFCRLDDGRHHPSTDEPDGVLLRDVAVPPKRHPWELIVQQRTFARRFAELLKELRPDVVHTNFCVPGVVARATAGRLAVPVVVSTQHELYGSMHPHYRWSVLWTRRHARTTVHISNAVARSFGLSPPTLDELNGSLPRDVVIPNGVDLAELDGVRRAASPRQPQALVCLGRLVPIKGHRFLLRAMPFVLRHFPDTYLQIIGDGPEKARLQHLAARLGIGDRVEFTAWLPPQVAISRAAGADALVVPGTQEGFGLVVAEAMALELPVVASRIPVFEEVLGSDDTGYFFMPRDPRALAAAIRQVFSDPAEAARRAAAARCRVVERFSSRRMVASYLQLYDRLTEAAG
jgi:glycosyltransferase involved in cell wall biosynthesis